MKVRGTLVIAAFVMAAAATVGVFAYVHSVKQDAKAGQDLVQVIVSKQDIPAGTSLDTLVSSGAFKTQAVPTDAVVPGAVTSLSELSSKQTSLPILAGEQIPTARLSGGTLGGGVLGIPRGYEALTLSLDSENVVGNEVRKGDHVTIYGSFDAKLAAQAETAVDGVVVTLVPDVLVLEGPSASDSSVSTGNGEITLSLKPADAQKLIYAQEQGQVWLTLLPPGQHGLKTPPATFIGVVK